MVEKTKQLSVWKFVVPLSDEFTLSMPTGAMLLYVDSQREKPCLWALVDPEAPTESRRFRFAGTGHPITQDPDSLSHVGSFMMSGGSLVFHLFEIL